jgi:uncharacterized Zn finger protein (UPF0148 family)
MNTLKLTTSGRIWCPICQRHAPLPGWRWTVVTAMCDRCEEDMGKRLEEAIRERTSKR